jgi:Glycosyl transferase family 90
LRRLYCNAMQVPDLEAVMHTNDSPLVPEASTAKEQPAPPIFGYTTAAGFTDVPFPDFSYWGHEHGRLVGALKPEPEILIRGLYHHST